MQQSQLVGASQRISRCCAGALLPTLKDASSNGENSRAGKSFSGSTGIDVSDDTSVYIRRRGDKRLIRASALTKYSRKKLVLDEQEGKITFTNNDELQSDACYEETRWESLGCWKIDRTHSNLPFQMLLAHPWGVIQSPNVLQMQSFSMRHILGCTMELVSSRQARLRM